MEGNLVPLTIMYPNSAILEKKGMRDGVIIVLEHKTLPTRPFFIPMFDGKRDMFVDYVERFVLNYPTCTTADIFRSIKQRIRGEFEDAWQGEIECVDDEAEDGKCTLGIPFHDWDGKKEYMLRIDNAKSDIEEVTEQALCKPFMEFKISDEEKTFEFVFFMEYLWLFYLNVKYGRDLAKVSHVTTPEKLMNDDQVADCKSDQFYI
jgi:hypothetical protein